MADGRSIFGTDTSLYQWVGTYDPGAFEIVNFEDPQLPQKVTDRAAEGKPWGVYLWIYSGHNLNVEAQHMVDIVRMIGIGDPPLGYWADYEDAGITEAQLDAFFAGADAKGVRAGYYSGPSAIDHGPFLTRPWWCAAYPTGEVEFPGYRSLFRSSRPRPMVLWQYTSAAGLDRNVVVDESWYGRRVRGTAALRAAQIEEDDDMQQFRVIKVGRKGRDGRLVDDPSRPEVYLLSGLVRAHAKTEGVLRTLHAEGRLLPPQAGIPTLNVFDVQVELRFPDYVDTFVDA